MDHDQKLAFLQNMTHMALSHAASVPNTPTPTGGMSHDKMMSFVSGIATKGLQHLAAGGAPGQYYQPGANPMQDALVKQTQQNAVPRAPNPVASAMPVGGGPITTAGGLGGGVSDAIGATDKFVAQAAPIQAGTSGAQLGDVYKGVQGAIGQQAQVAGNLNNGLNQGIANQSALSNMYLNQANGQGPNPALAQFNQATGQNINQQAALAAGQRGAGANVGLAQRQNAQLGAATGQQAAGQSAIMQAQQQLAAQQNLQNLSANQIAQGTSATQGLNNAQQNEQQILQGANTAANNALVSQQSNLNNVNAQVAIGNADQSGSLAGQLLGGAASVLPFLAAAHGGEITKDKMQVEQKPIVSRPHMMAEDGQIVGQQTSGPQSYVGQWLNSQPINQTGPQIEPLNINRGQRQSAPDLTKDIGAVAGGIAGLSGPKSSMEPFTNIAEPSMDTTNIGQDILGNLSPFSPSVVGPLRPEAHGGLMKSGGPVKAGPGQKAVKDGDSLQNDKIPTMLSEGEIVIPRHITMGPNAPAQAALFVAKEIAKRGKKK